jgi:hypothetical protein
MICSEEGFSLVELVAAMTIMGAGFFALAGAAGTGARLLAEGKQRQAATEIAGREIEHLRNLPYDQVALTEAPPTATDPDDPDSFVNADRTRFDYTGTPTWEDLVVDATAGQVVHHEDLTVGSTQLRIHRFVTWVDDPDVTGTQDYKRVTMVVAYRAPVNTGRPLSVRASALFTPGYVLIGGSGLGPTQGTNPAPVPSPTVGVPVCVGDSTAPTGTFTILSGTGAADGYTASTTIVLSLAPSDPCTPITAEFSNDGTLFGGRVTYNPALPTATWTISNGDGLKSVWARYADANGNTRTVGPKTITLDTTKPTVPGTLTRTVSCSGANRTVNLSWSTSTDSNLVGYRVYRSINEDDYEVVVTTTAVSGSNTHAKNLDSVRFYVVAFDKAGNESLPTNEVSLAKNQCS